MRGVAMLVFANKQDLPRAMSVSDITDGLGLSGVSQPVGVRVYPQCNAVVESNSLLHVLKLHSLF